MTITISEITSKTIEPFYDALEWAYAHPGHILCPAGEGVPPIPPREDAQGHLDYGRRFIVARDDGLLTHTLLVEDGKIRTCWGSIDKVAMGLVQWKFAAWFESVGEQWLLDTNAPGRTTRIYFERYAPGGGPFDVTTTHPGLPDGTTYADFDDHKWSLHIWRISPDHAWQWEVNIHG